jgi:hypothetical protein
MQGRLQNVYAEKNGVYGGTLEVRAISEICKGSVSVYLATVGHYTLITDCYNWLSCDRNELKRMKSQVFLQSLLHATFARHIYYR